MEFWSLQTAVSVLYERCRLPFPDPQSYQSTAQTPLCALGGILPQSLAVVQKLARE
jgi:hypothetical protein